MLRNKKYEKQMKKIIIINNNLKIGGIQKALINLLNEVSCSYDITLLLFRKVGQYLRDIPQNVKVLEVNSDFQYLAISQSECVRFKDKIKRAFYVIYTRFFGFSKTIKLLNKKQKIINDYYDVAISFQHCAAQNVFYGGTSEFVLNFINADKKICFIHCDYQNSGTSYPYIDKLYKQFDRIACVSESVKNKFLKVIPEIENKTVVVRNCNNVTQIKAYAEENTYIYDKNYINILTISRLSEEKGIERAIMALKNSNRKDIRYYIVGEGPSKKNILKIIHESQLDSQVYLLGADANPYKYLKNADYLFLASYHEAAPMVFDEAKILGVPILTTETTSAYELVVKENSGIMCENSQQGLEIILSSLSKKFIQLELHYTNELSRQQFFNLLIKT